MLLQKFSEYYINSLIKNSNDDYDYCDDFDKWISDHLAITLNGSLVIGIIKEENVIKFKNFIDIDILPEIFKVIKKNINNQIVFITSETEVENYIYESMCKKFPYIKFLIKKSSSDILNDIKLVESDNKIAIIIVESSKIFSLKKLIEYI